MTFAAIASGCAAIIVAGGFIEDTLTILNEGYISQYLGHIQISRKGYMADGVAAPFDYMIPNAGPLTSLVSKTAHVQRISPRIGFSGLLGLGESSASFIAEGYSPENEDATRMVFTSGENLNSDDRFKVILGTGLAQALNIKVGDTAVLMATSQSGAINGMDITVKGISHSVSKEFDDHFLGLTLKTAQKLLRTNDIQTLTVFLDKTSNTDIVALELKKMVSEKNLDLDVTPWYQLPGADFVVKLVQFYAKLFSVFKIIIVAVVVLSIFNTMNMSVVERVGEIGTLMALGTKRSTVVQLFILEGFILGVLGGLLGLVIGYGLVVGISAVGIKMPTPPGTTVQWIAHIKIVPRIFVEAYLMSLATALVSVILPALKASHYEIAEALRQNV